MPDTPEDPSRALIPFTPVPRQKDRSNGWKPEVQQAFIEALSDYGCVNAAARAVRRAPVGAYALRRHPEGAGFAAAWEAALDHGIRRLEDALMERALNGVDVPVYSYGKLVGKRTTYNDRLGMFMLRNRAPDRYAVGGGARALNAVGKMEIERLKKQWHAESLKEELEDREETRASLDRFLQNIKDNRQANTSPAQRERQIAAEAQGRADSAAGWRSGRPYAPYAAKAAELLPQFIAEVEARWPPLRADAWEWPDDDSGYGDGRNEGGDDWGHDGSPPPPAPSPPPPDKPEPPAGPRIRTLKDDRW